MTWPDSDLQISLKLKMSLYACVTSSFSHVQLFATQWTIARQALLSVGFSRHEYWSGLPCPSPGDLPDPGIKPSYLASPVLTGRFFTTAPPKRKKGIEMWMNCCLPSSQLMLKPRHFDSTSILLTTMLYDLPSKGSNAFNWFSFNWPLSSYPN